MRWNFWRRSQSHHAALYVHLADLARFMHLSVDQAYRFLIIDGVTLPPGYNCASTRLLVEIPPDYPQSPPGIGDYRVYVPSSLRFQGRQLRHVHPHETPRCRTHGADSWAWLCYERIAWDPARDDLIRFQEMVRADLTNPFTH